MSISVLTTRKKISRSLAKKAREITAHVIDALKPSKVFLIGSMARGIVHQYSDLDLVVIIEGKFRRQDLCMRALPTRPHFDVPLDLHLISKKDFDKFKNLGGLSFEAEHHGQLIYEEKRDFALRAGK